MPTTSPDNIYYADGSTPMSAEDISAAEATSVQAALDALVNDSRQIQTFVWANAAARTAQTGMIAGDFGFQTDTGTTYRYTGSAWLAFYPGGQVSVVPSSVSGTGVTFSSDTGLVTIASGATECNINGVFTSSFTNYIMFFRFVTTAGGLNAQLVSSGTPAATAYDNERFTSISTASTSVQALNQTVLQPLPIGVGGIHAGNIELYSPAVVTPTIVKSDYVATPNPMTTSGGGGKSFMLHRTSSGYDGFRFAPPSGTFSGTVQVYGYA